MLNLNYLLLQVLQEKLTKERALSEINDYLINNEAKVSQEKELKSWLSKQAKSPRPVLAKSGKYKDYQIFTDTAVMYASTTERKDIEISNEFPPCDKILEATLTGGTKFNLRQLYNASQIAKNEVRTCLLLKFSDLTIKLKISAIEDAYKVSGIIEGTIKMVKDKDNHSPLYIYSNTNKDFVIITPCNEAQDDTTLIAFNVGENGSISFETKDKLATIKVEPKVVVEAKPKEVKVIPKVRNLNDKEQATTKQISYLAILTGKAKADFETLTKAEASKMITKIKVANAKVCEA